MSRTNQPFLRAQFSSFWRKSSKSVPSFLQVACKCWNTAIRFLKNLILCWTTGLGLSSQESYYIPLTIFLQKEQRNLLPSNDLLQLTFIQGLDLKPVSFFSTLHLLLEIKPFACTTLSDLQMELCSWTERSLCYPLNCSFHRYTTVQTPKSDPNTVSGTEEPRK